MSVFLLTALLFSFSLHFLIFVTNKGIITFRVSRTPREMYCGHARLCVCVCVCVCLSVCPRPHMPTLLHGSGCN